MSNKWKAKNEWTKSYSVKQWIQQWNQLSGVNEKNMKNERESKECLMYFWLTILIYST